MVHRNIEKTLDLVGVQVNRNNPISPRDAQKVGNHFS
jgi:hypothetical protein